MQNLTVSIRSTWVLIMLGIISTLSFVIVENSKQFKRQDYYNEKLAASILAKKSAEHLKRIQYGDDEFIENLNDPNETGLIGQEFTSITTGKGSLPMKISTTNPNFAALSVQLLKEAGLRKGDKVALCMTGSFPGLNIAMLSAIKVLELQPLIICSETSSTWGATNPNYTWTDMLRSLNKVKYIPFEPIANSIGGNQDIGRGLSNEGIEHVIKAIERSGKPFINGQSLFENIQQRLNFFDKNSQDKPIKLFVNIGGGAASLGSVENGKAFKSGLSMDVKLASIPDKQGVLFEMAKKGVPIIHLLHIDKLLNKFELPREPFPLPEPGKGSLFEVEKYNLLLVVSLTLVIVSILAGLMYIDKNRNELGNEIIKDEPEI
jgi:poly-gamma-glutamate system protein